MADLPSTYIKEHWKGLQIKVYTRRFIVLFLLSFQLLLGYWMYMTFSVITSTVSYFYQVQDELVDLLTSAYALSYAVLALPMVWITHRHGLSRVMITSASFNALCASFRFASLSYDNFYFIVLGNIFLIISCILTLALPAKLAAVWFPVGERATAIAIAVIMQFIGGGLSWIVTMYTVGNTRDGAVIRRGLYNIFLSQLIASVVCLSITYLFIKERPVTPPSLAEIKRKRGRNDFKENLNQLLKNRHYFLHCIVYAINYACSMSFVIVLSQFVSAKYQDSTYVTEKALGISGMGTYLSSIIGSFLAGRAQDKCKNYKCMALFIASATTILIIATAGALFLAIDFYVFSAIIISTAASSSAYLNFGLELISEVSYPCSEEVACMLPFMLGNLFAFCAIHAFQVMLDRGLVNYALLIGPALALIMLICVIIAKTPMKRTQESHNFDSESCNPKTTPIHSIDPS